ncbi:hypothetical protein R1sor_004117 [Riccia sorocarpa]|uniref:Myb-like domain-containing protein n=1 Tax=Riccia sorocarpa TaxID=122646 RepID=A0ABD3H6W3_9MARC
MLESLVVYPSDPYKPIKLTNGQAVKSYREFAREAAYGAMSSDGQQDEAVPSTSKGEKDNNEQGKERNLSRSYADLRIEYKKDQRLQRSHRQDETENMETLCYKVHNVMDKRGAVITSHEFDRCSWRSDEIEQLIVMRCSVTEKFEKALKMNCSSSLSLWEDIAKQLPKESELEDTRTAKECMWLWNMLIREYTSVLEKKKEEPEFPFFEFMDNAMKFIYQAKV